MPAQGYRRQLPEFIADADAISVRGGDNASLLAAFLKPKFNILLLTSFDIFGISVEEKDSGW